MLLSPFKIFIDILSSNLPTLPIVPLMKKKIRNMCTAGTDDSKDISKVKKCILKNLDKRFPKSDKSRIQQLLDPEIKHIIPRLEAAVILEKAINNAIARQLSHYLQNNLLREMKVITTVNLLSSYVLK